MASTRRDARDARAPAAEREDTRDAPDLSVVVPVYDEERNLRPLMERLGRALGATGRTHEIIFVDDGSRDGSLEVLAELSAERGVRVVELTRNHGQHPAVMAGFSVARGAIVVTLDADLQNPPEEIPRLLRTLEEGDWDVVGGVRAARRDPLLRRLASRAVNAVARRITGVAVTDWGCMLRAYRRDVVERMVESNEDSTFIPALATLYAKRVTEVPVEHAERHAGSSRYGLWKLLALQFDLVTSFTDFPLRVLLYAGGALSIGAASFGVLLAVLRLVRGDAWGGYGLFSLFAVMFFLVGALFAALGILGQYVGRIYREVRRRPRFAIRRVLGG